MDKKKFMYFAITAIVLILILLVVRFLTTNNKDKALYFENYLYYDNDKISEEGFKVLEDDDNVSNTYYTEAIFLGKSGTAYFYRTNFDKVFVKNTFVFELEEAKDETRFDNEIQGFVSLMKTHIHFEGATTNNLVPIDGKTIDEDISILSNVLNKNAELVFSMVQDENYYSIRVYNENDKFMMEITYTKLKVIETDTPDDVNGN